jgi:hypothetical protein
MRNTSHFVLDNTLWLLYRTIKLHGGTIMAIRFKHRGQQYEADTPDEAIRMREMLEKYDEEDVKHGNITEEELIYEKTKWSEDRFLSMTQNIGVAQQKFLAVLFDSPRGPVNVETIAKKLGVNSAMALAGVQSGLAKQLRAMGLEPIDLYRVEISWVGDERKRYLTLNEGFRLAALDVGWPPDYIRKALKEAKQK